MQKENGFSEMATVFIDGSAGTTGLRIHERLQERTDIQVLKLPEELRKDAAARAEMLNTADISFLCLPDAAAIEAAGMVTNPNAVLDCDYDMLYNPSDPDGGANYLITPVWHGVMWKCRMSALPDCVKAINKSNVTSWFVI